MLIGELPFIFHFLFVYAVRLSCVCPETLSMFKGPLKLLSLCYKKKEKKANLELSPVVYLCVFGQVCCVLTGCVRLRS